MEVVDLVGWRYPDVQALWLTPWYYYACRKQLLIASLTMRIPLLMQS